MTDGARRLRNHNEEVRNYYYSRSCSRGIRTRNREEKADAGTAKVSRIGIKRRSCRIILISLVDFLTSFQGRRRSRSGKSIQNQNKTKKQDPSSLCRRSRNSNSARPWSFVSM